MSHVLASTSSAIFVLNVLLLSATGFVMLASGSLWIAVHSLALAIVINLFAWRRAELWPIDTDTVTTARRAGLLVALVALLGKLFLQ